jgi:hypothetical protein
MSKPSRGARRTRSQPKTIEVVDLTGGAAAPTPVPVAPTIEDADLESAMQALKRHDPDGYARIAVCVVGMVATYERPDEPEEIHAARHAFARAPSRGRS